MHEPLVTIAMTCYNAEETILRAVKGALSQDWPNTELIIVDDLSTDRSAEIVRTVADKAPNVRVIVRQTNGGVSAALNTAIDNAKGEFIAIFDDDDESVPRRISLQVNRLCEFERRNGEQLILCFGARAVVKAGESLPDHEWVGIGHSPPEPRGSELVDHILGIQNNPRFNGGIGAGTMLARRSTFDAIGPFDEKIRRGVDWDYAIRVGFLGGTCISAQDVVVTTYKTQGAEKSPEIVLVAQLAIIHKHRVNMKHYRYLCARNNAFITFYRNTDRTIMFYALRLFAIILKPTKIFKRFCQRTPSSRA